MFLPLAIEYLVIAVQRRDDRRPGVLFRVITPGIPLAWLAFFIAPHLYGGRRESRPALRRRPQRYLDAASDVGGQPILFRHGQSHDEVLDAIHALIVIGGCGRSPHLRITPLAANRDVTPDNAHPPGSR